MIWLFSYSRGTEGKIVDSGAIKLGAGGPALPAQSLPLTKLQPPFCKRRVAVDDPCCTPRP